MILEKSPVYGAVQPEVIILITIDSLRRDHLGCYGYQNVETPTIDGLASSGIRFDNTFSHGGGTPESFPSIMSSCPPPIRLQDRGVKGKKTLAHLMKECGFNTGGFHTNPFLSARNGYDYGFDAFYEGPWSRLPPKIQAISTSLDHLILNRGPSSNGWLITRMAANWLKTARSPAFLWLHYMDAHVPFLPEAGRIGLVRSLKTRPLMMLVLSKKVPNRQTLPTQATKNALMYAYDACISKLDTCISFLLSEVSKRFDRKLVMITADHGEAYWEHGFFGHSGVYDEVLQVPLVISGDGARKGTVVKSLVTLADIYPTVAEFVGQKSEKTYGRSMINSDSISDTDRMFVSTSINPAFDRRYVGVRSSSEKYIRQESVDGSKMVFEKYFDLRADSEEKKDILAQKGHEVQAARDEISRLYGENYASQEVLSTEEEKVLMQRFRSLGYE